MDSNYTRTKYCSYCGEQIGYDVRRCPYCASIDDSIYVRPAAPAVNRMAVPAETSGQTARPWAQPAAQPWAQQAAQAGVSPTVQPEDQPEVQPADQPEVQPEAQPSPTPAAQPSAQPATQPAAQAGVTSGAGIAGIKPLSNAKKVLISVLCTIIPGFGQLAAVIISIVFMNNEEDADRRSFGTALLAASLAVFLLSGVFYFIALLFLISQR